MDVKSFKKFPPPPPQGIANIIPLDFVATNSIYATSTSGFSVDWGNGNPINYAAGTLVLASSVASGNIIVDAVDITHIRFFGDTYKEIDINDGTTLTSMVSVCQSLLSLLVFNATNTQNVTDFGSAWSACSGLTSFPLIDMSSGTEFDKAWYNCSGLTSFPLIDMSSGIIFHQAWRLCSGLTSFPAIDMSSGTVFSNAWDNCYNLTSFPAIDVSSGTDFRLAWFGCSSITSFSAIDTSSGTLFGSTWSTCTSLVCLSSVNTLLQANTTDMFLNTPALVAPNASEQTQIENGFNYINPGACP